ncbi:hypothetical protein [Nitrospira sp. M1]
MNTPAHLLVNLALLGRQESPRHQLYILTGAILPDAPMFLFYFIEKVLRNIPEHVIWSHDYYLEAWQNFFDCFNSLPFIIIGLLIAWITHSKAGLFLCTSMMLHVFADLPLHHDDGHRHFLPLSDWRFESPISYWDPQHYGHLVTGLEVVVVLISAISVLHGTSSSLTKWFVGIVGISYFAFFGYALWVWA